MKRFFLGLIVGFLAVSALWDHSRANAPVPVPPPAPPLPPPPVYGPAVAHGPGVVVVQNDPNAGFPPVPDGRESVQDIPVPIVPGTRVTRAKVQPPKPPTTPRRPGRDAPSVADHGRRAPRADNGLRTITGRISADEERAREDVRKMVDQAIGEWLAPEVPSSWRPPASMRAALVQKTEVRPVEKEIEGERRTMFEAAQTVDFSPARRTALVEAYQRELVARRLAILAGVLAFVLSCLAALAGYIRADEATKGYYTNRLRLVSAAGVGAAGVLIYQLLV